MADFDELIDALIAKYKRGYGANSARTSLRTAITALQAENERLTKELAEAEERAENLNTTIAMLLETPYEELNTDSMYLVQNLIKHQNEKRALYLLRKGAK